MTSSSHASSAGTIRPLRRLGQILRPDQADIGAVLTFTVVIGLLNLAVPLAVESLVSTVAFGGLLQPVIVLSALLFSSLIIANGMLALQTYLVELIQRRLFVRVVAEVAHRLPRTQVEAFDLHYGPELVNRFFEVLTLQKTTASLLLDGTSVLVSAVVSMTVLAFYHPLLLGLDVLLVIVLSFIILVLGRNAVRTSIEESITKYAVAESLEELARYPLAFRAPAAMKKTAKRVDALMTEYLQARAKHFQILFRQVVFTLGLQAMTSTVLLGLGGLLVIQDQLTLGQLVAAELIIAYVVGAFAKLCKHMESYYDLMASVDKIGHLLDLPQENEVGESVAPRPQGIAVELKHVTYDYPGHGPRVAFAPKRIEPGERLMLQAAQAVGKSTLADLLFGLRMPSAGAITYDDHDTRHWALSELRRQVALVRGEEVIAGTVLDNIRWYRDEIEIERMHQVLQDVDLTTSIERLPQGWNTLLTASGTPLTTSQLRQLMLARALVAAPRLLILDGVLEALAPDVREHILLRLEQRYPMTTVIALVREIPPTQADWRMDDLATLEAGT